LPGGPVDGKKPVTSCTKLENEKGHLGGYRGKRLQGEGYARKWQGKQNLFLVQGDQNGGGTR